MRTSGRWHTQGSHVVYLSESPSAALLEILVHLNSQIGKLPDTYTLLRIDVSPRPRIRNVPGPLPANWKSDIAWSRRIGDEWLKANRTAFARVPSVVTPHTFNYLFNPIHDEAANARIVQATLEQFDRRLFGQIVK